MTALESWLKQATLHLSADSIAQVQSEIQEHYESALEAAMTGGATAEEAEQLAVSALGDAKLANRQYRGVLLTAVEARVLRDGTREARFLCSRRGVRPLLFAISMAALLTAVVLMLTGASTVVWALVMVAMCGPGLLFVLSLLPVYTPSRGRVFRWLKWIVLAGALGLAFGSDARNWSWLLISCLWPMVWAEWTRVSLRRKLPVKRWHLYL